jgi:hypothetical protein
VRASRSTCIYELKYDGFRALAMLGGSNDLLFGRGYDALQVFRLNEVAGARGTV